MSAQAAIERLMKIHPKGFDLSLDRVTRLLEKLGNPHLKIPPAFHVAGTNGKGSTSAFLRAILEAAGKSVHVHTSPHLVNWNERYRIGKAGGGKFVDDKILENAIERAEKVNGGKAITVFEIMSAVGFILFSEHPADYTIMEVGLGGRFDATNVLRNPAACIITPVALDHQAYLGDTIGKIAFEKAGIIKDRAPVIIGEQKDEGLSVIEERAKEAGSRIIAAHQDFDYYLQAGRFVFQDETGLLDLPLPALLGDHQLANAACAIAACRQVLPNLPDGVFETAMQSVFWPGRFERLKHGKLSRLVPANAEIWIDGGHNPQAGEVIAKTLSNIKDAHARPMAMIVGMLTTKEASGFFKPFKKLSPKVWTIPVNQSDAGFDPQRLSEIAIEAGLPAIPAGSIESALEEVAKEVGEVGMRILICGSLYMVGEVLDKNGTPPV